MGYSIFNDFPSEEETCLLRTTIGKHGIQYTYVQWGMDDGHSLIKEKQGKIALRTLQRLLYKILQNLSNFKNFPRSTYI